jgi:hypothetical protein
MSNAVLGSAISKDMNFLMLVALLKSVIILLCSGSVLSKIKIKLPVRNSNKVVFSIGRYVYSIIV